jgi:two-component system, sensor histidine kinase and response regulator
LLDSILSALGKERVKHTRKQQRWSNNSETAQSVRGAYVLLVDDNRVNQELAMEILQDAGLRVDLADNGAQAITMVNMSDYDGILMDCQMPVMDGFEATRRIRTDARFATLPILAMTANATQEAREMCLACGMNDHISKPVDINQLFSMLARWIKPKANAITTIPAMAAVTANQTPNDETPSSPESTTTSAHTNPSSPPSDPGLPPIPCLDLELAERRMGGNLNLVRKLVVRFAQTQADAITRIRAAIQADDIVTATREVHTTKGLAGNIGAMHLLTRAATLETMLIHHQSGTVPAALMAMEQELAIVITQIRQATETRYTAAEMQVAPNTMLNHDALSEQFQQLAVLLNNNDTRAEKRAESIGKTLHQLGLGDAATQLVAQINDYEFEAALNILDTSAKTLGITL